ncbi:hypothetical protein BDV35DRAFT_392068 [Aspergillus flavus]|uniref:Uncharacterized protein n=1 Tax=Aspergillus flavus TaxID=5059 RepID=A0A5N6H1B8_ASPFL|nr:hypothetical protein BDV35DRAFT_392068 [Aspergillus flavus]
MEDVERDFEIPKTPVPMNIPSWGIPVPATLGLQAIIVIALLANAYESASSKLEGLTTA